MKMQIVTNKKGEVIGTARTEHHTVVGAPKIGRIIPSPEQKVHEIDIPNDILEIKGVKEFHKALEKHLK